MSDSTQEMTAPRSNVAAARETLLRIMKALTHAELYPYEGEWLTQTEVRERSRRNRRRSLVHLVEVILLIGFGAALTALLIGLVWLICY